MKLFNCPACGGDGKETCNNPDHGFIRAMPGDIGRMGCPVCGHDEDHKVYAYKDGKRYQCDCDACGGGGLLTEEQALKVADEWGFDDELEEVENLKKLHVILKGKWFEMFDQEIKTDEYRSLTQHWVSRLMTDFGAYEDEEGFHCNFKAKHFDLFEIQHGYSKGARRILFSLKGIEVGKGKPEWGGSSENVFIIKTALLLNRNF